MKRPATSRGERPAAAYVRPEIAVLAGYVPGEQPSDPAIVKLNTNENPYPPAPAVRDAILAACDALHLYPDPSARLIRARVAELFGVDADGVLVGNGSDELLSILMRAAVGPGDVVAYPTPTYSLYDTLVSLEGARPLHVPFADDHALPDRLFEVDARMLVVCNPNAPSGTVVPRSRLADLARARRDALVVVDEAYVDFADAHATSLPVEHPNVVTLRTLSKSYSLAGLRLGFACATPDLARELTKVKDSYNVSRLAQAGALAALNDQATMLEHVARVRATRARLTDALVRLGYVVPPSQTNFVLARKPGVAQRPVADALRERGILVRWFAVVPDAIRVTIGTDEQIDRLLEELRRL